MKKCIVISDSFKGSLPSRDICAIARERIPLFFHACEVRALNVADGGEASRRYAARAPPAGGACDAEHCLFATRRAA